MNNVNRDLQIHSGGPQTSFFIVTRNRHRSVGQEHNTDKTQESRPLDYWSRDSAKSSLALRAVGSLEQKHPRRMALSDRCVEV